ncbi:helix-turn-helix domain-containing protein [Ureibacillus sp. FSL K6-8385]|uniref:Helix-turn-helix transcriptional regulator n=1 Tax=Ureibacillus terrenus TaxID=118246 RepID=A0A540UWX3_9BACL|nr:helix-turn-helix domain-containing protein [Ureibacillus terrenus]MED3661766.1 helix-turn-helix domain-containing protein [Ureibacillus terrenus]MED3763452.1 helix-turn-helix domain-containing protein [Ureibacillus terrenus]TQE89000.1 helix-turn-helix transcriptional regulator [Ureibacillus terrenus]
METKTRYDIPCNIAQSLNIIGDRWTLLIIHEILVGHTLFNEIKKSLKGISSNLLSERLKYLEQHGLVETELYSEHPPRYCYKLTESGKELEDVFNALIIWGSKHLKKCYKKIIDAETGDEVEIGYYSKKTGERVKRIAVVPIGEEIESK